MAFEKLVPHHVALAQKMAVSTESTGGLCPGIDEGSKELLEDHAIRAPPVPKLLVDTKEKEPDNFIVKAPGGQQLRGFGNLAFL